MTRGFDGALPLSRGGCVRRRVVRGDWQMVFLNMILYDQCTSNHKHKPWRSTTCEQCVHVLCV
jgi:hypothetical protein